MPITWSARSTMGNEPTPSSAIRRAAVATVSPERTHCGSAVMIWAAVVVMITIPSGLPQRYPPGTLPKRPGLVHRV